MVAVGTTSHGLCGGGRTPERQEKPLAGGCRCGEAVSSLTGRQLSTAPGTRPRRQRRKRYDSEEQFLLYVNHRKEDSGHRETFTGFQSQLWADVIWGDRAGLLPQQGQDTAEARGPAATPLASPSPAFAAAAPERAPPALTRRRQVQVAVAFPCGGNTVSNPAPDPSAPRQKNVFYTWKES